eukprot:PhF_6_TR31551/c0_g1_i1/m.46589
MDLVDGIPSIFDCNENIIWALSNSTSIPYGGEYMVIKDDEFVLQDSNFDGLWNSRPIQLATLPLKESVASGTECPTCNVTPIVAGVVIAMLVLWITTMCLGYCVMKKQLKIALRNSAQPNPELSEMTKISLSPTQFGGVGTSQIEQNPVVTTW